MQKEAASVTLRLKHAEARLRRALVPSLQEHGVTFEQWQVLAAVTEQPGIRMTDLAELAAVPPATLTRHVDQLVARALLIRRIDPADRRSSVVAPSTLGGQVAGRLRELEDAAPPALGVRRPDHSGR